jgi:hypothetical protein
VRVQQGRDSDAQTRPLIKFLSEWVRPPPPGPVATRSRKVSSRAMVPNKGQVRAARPLPTLTLAPASPAADP